MKSALYFLGCILIVFTSLPKLLGAECGDVVISSSKRTVWTKNYNETWYGFPALDDGSPPSSNPEDFVVFGTFSYSSSDDWSVEGFYASNPEGDWMVGGHGESSYQFGMDRESGDISSCDGSYLHHDISNYTSYNEISGSGCESVYWPDFMVSDNWDTITKESASIVYHDSDTSYPDDPDTDYRVVETVDYETTLNLSDPRTANDIIEAAKANAEDWMEIYPIYPTSISASVTLGSTSISASGNVIKYRYEWENLCGEYEAVLSFEDWEGSTLKDKTEEKMALEEEEKEDGTIVYFIEDEFSAPLEMTRKLVSVKAVPKEPKEFGTTCPAQLNSAHWSVSLGLTSQGTALGTLSLSEETLTASSSTPSALFVGIADPAQADVVKVSNVLRQIKVPDGLVDVQTASPLEYSLVFYKNASVGTKDSGTGLYAITGSSVYEWKIYNPDTSGLTHSELVLEQIVGGNRMAHFIEDTVNGSWSLNTGNGLRIETRQTTVNGDDRTVLTTIKNASDEISEITEETHHEFAWGEEKVQERIDPSGLNLTSTWSYYDDEENDEEAYSKLKESSSASGRWQRFKYDSEGRLWKRYEGFLNDAPTWTDADCQVTENTYSVDGLTTTVTRVHGVETARSYRVKSSDGLETAEITCVTAGASVSATDNLVTITRILPDTDPFAGETASVLHSDGTLTVYGYAQDSTSKTTTTRTGEPNQTGDDVVDGEETVQVETLAGYLVSRIVTDIATGITIASEVVVTSDSLGRPTLTSYLNGRTEARTYNCCYLESSTDRYGIVTTYAYDALGRIDWQETLDIKTKFYYDASGRVRKRERVTDENTEDEWVTILEVNEYDLAGRLKKHWDAMNNLTEYGYSVSGYQETRTVTNADGGTSVSQYFRDGREASLSGSAVAPKAYEYEATTTGFRQRTYFIGEGGAQTEWAETYQDIAGRTFKTVYPDAAEEIAHYNLLGQLDYTVDADGVTTLYEYNGRGEQFRQAINMNANVTIDLDGTDRVTETLRTYADLGGSGDAEVITSKVYPTLNDATPLAVSVSQRLLESDGSMQIEEGLTTSSTTSYSGAGDWTITTENPDGTKVVESYEDGRLSTTAQYTAGTPGTLLKSIEYHYDEHGRVEEMVDASLGITSLTHYNNDQVQTRTTPHPGGSTGGGPQTTEYIYDEMGRLEETILPDASHQYTTYYPTGAVMRSWGSQTYPVYYQYTPQGRLWKLTTSEGTQMEAITTWEHHAQRGWLAAKKYADNQGPTYTYTDAGRLWTRTWQRGTVTTYGYDGAGTLASIDYSDSTPDVVYTIDRLGRIAGVSDGAGTSTITYAGLSGVADETYATGILSGYTIDRSQDSLQRLSGLELKDGTSTYSQVSYTYESTTSRLWKVTQGDYVATYTYADAEGHPGLVKGLAFTDGGQARLTNARVYDNLGRLVSTTNTPAGSGATAQSYTYAMNGLNQRTRVTREDGSYWQYVYDAKGQLEDAKRHWVDNSLVAGQQREYAYDEIGNRTTAKEGGNATGGDLRTTTYSANLLNQYDSRTVPGAVDAFGLIDEGGRVVVDGKRIALPTTGTTPGLDALYWWAEVAVPNAAAIAEKEIRIAAAKLEAGTSGEDLVTLEKRDVILPQTPEVFAYDDDGNMTADGLRTYVWDGENRLIEVHPKAGLAALGGSQSAYYTYDHQSRRIQKTLYNVDTSNTQTTQISSRRYIYEGWNLIAEFDSTVSGDVVQTWTWGLDLSGSIQGVGGVGGLLWRRGVATGQEGNHAFAYDGNGNVTACVDLDIAEISAEYAYDPFGNTLEATGSFADENPFRFSSKFTDSRSENGALVYYGYRLYNPVLARWINRDPIEELGGLNLVGFLQNESINSVDINGTNAWAAILAGILGVYIDSLWLPNFLNDLSIDYMGGAEKFMDATEDQLATKGGPLAVELFQKARRKDSSRISQTVNVELHDRIQSQILSSKIYQEKRAYILKRLQDGTLHKGFINIDFKGVGSPDLAYAIGGAQLHYEYKDGPPETLTLRLIETYDFTNKGHEWGRLQQKGYLVTYTEDIFLEETPCPKAAPEKK